MTTTIQDTPVRPQTSVPHRNWRARLGTHGPLLAVLAVTLAFTLIAPGEFAQPSNFKALLDQAAVPLILAMGATFVILMGAIDLSVEGLMATSGLTFVLLSANTSNGNDLGLLAPLVAIAVTSLMGLATGTIHTRLRAPSFMVSLGVWYIGLGIATVLFGDAVPRLRTTGMTAWTQSSVLGMTYPLLLAVGVVAIAAALSRWTKFGRYAFAIGADESTARLAMIPVKRYKTYVFGFAGLCSGLAGVVMTARMGVGVVDVGSGQLFSTIAAVVVGGTLLSGGKGGVYRSVCGVLLLTVINNGLVVIGISPVIQRAASSAVIVAAVIATGLSARSRLRVVK